MAKGSLKSWDVTASLNTDVGGIAILGSSNVSNFDNAIREMMAQLAGAKIIQGGESTTLSDAEKLIAFANIGATSSLTNPSGYQKLPSGWLIQWGYSDDGQTDLAVTFPITFPNNIRAVVASSGGSVATTSLISVVAQIVDNSTFNIRKRIASNGGTVTTSTNPVSWIAVGV